MPPLPYRARPPVVLLGVGAVLVVSACASVAAASGGGPVRALLLVVAGAGAGLSVRAGRAGLRSTEETLAASAVALALVAGDVPDRIVDGAPTIPALVAVCSVALHRLAPAAAAWPLAAWVTAQLAVVRLLDGADPGVGRNAVLVGVSLVGLLITLGGRRLVARVALVTAAPWWVLGVAGGLSTAWQGQAAERWLSAVLVLVAAAQLLVARCERTLEPLLGPPRAVPLLAGAVTGAAVGAALSTPGPVALPSAGYAGVLLTAVAATSLSGWRRGLFLPAAAACGSTLIALSVVQLTAAGRWPALCLLLSLSALPAAIVAVLRPDERSTALPLAVGCLGAAAMLAIPAEVLTTGWAATALTALYAATVAPGSALDRELRRPTAAVGAACAVAAVGLLVAVGARGQLAAHLAVQGALTCGWAWRTGRTDADEDEPPAGAAWPIGAAQLVVAAWIAAAVWHLPSVEAYTLPAAAGLLLASGPRLGSGPSWPAWGPGLLVAAVPSGVLAVAAPGSLRPVAVLAVAAAAMISGARAGLRAPLATGAGTALAVAVGLALVELPWPVGAALTVGAVLLAVGAFREGNPVAGFGARLADLR